ncbi:MAG: hypothetical protein WBM99_09115, partial [Psychromonas sp.]
MLLLMGCEKAQGYKIAKPMPSVIFSQWLSNYSPNKNWLICGNEPRNNKENSLAIFTIISNQCMDIFRGKIESSPVDVKPWPILDNQRCHCGNWINREKKEQLFAKEDMQRLEQVHNKIHFIADAIQRKYQGGDIETARANLPELELAMDEMSKAVDLCK